MNAETVGGLKYQDFGLVNNRPCQLLTTGTLEREQQVGTGSLEDALRVAVTCVGDPEALKTEVNENQ